MKLLMICIALLSFESQSKEVEFLHWWTSKGEVAALKVMEDALVAQDHIWKSTPVKGGGGDTAMAVLQARAIAGNPPTLAQIEGMAIKSWAKLGFLSSLDTVAQVEKWDEVMLPTARSINKFEGHYVAVPITIHRVNWMWVNNLVLAKAGLEVPQTWSEFIAALKVLKTKEIKPLALGNSPWQISMLFENIALGIGGQDYYQKALVEMSPEALNSQEMVDILNVFRQIGDITKGSLTKQRWDEATNELINNEAAFQILGDWVIGELISDDAQIPDHISCFVSPQTEGVYIYNMDSFVIFNQSFGFQKSETDGLGKTLSSVLFQKEFSKKKGSIPARGDIPLNDFNICSQQSRRDFDISERNDALVPSMTDSMAVAPIVQNAIIEELYRFFNDSTKTPEQLISRLIAISSSRSGYN
ncbi:ABC transporter substrate-binding protein [Vibrio sp. F74]|uniref:ABC transporter substrate-binding protein n=1 Tax=Vibrio sp. F74 TaxID=700020 RepID=UPI0035F55580